MGCFQDTSSVIHRWGMFKLSHPFNRNVTNLIFDNNDNKNACVQIGLNRLF